MVTDHLSSLSLIDLIPFVYSILLFRPMPYAIPHTELLPVSIV